MIVVTTDEVPGRKTRRALGLVRGGTVRAKHIGEDMMAMFRNVVGGEVIEYTKILAESREQALDRMMHDAERLGADAIVAVSFCSAEMMQGAAEIFVYGTAVELEPEGADS